MSPIAAICQRCKTIVPTVDHGLCPTCAKDRDRTNQTRRAAHPRTTIYATPQWRRASRACLTRDHWRCVQCGRHRTQLEPGERLGADHIIPILQCPDPYNLDNLQTLCSTCSGHKDGGRAHD